MRTEPEAVQRAENLSERTDDDATRETLRELLAAYRKLQRQHNYALHVDAPEPDPMQPPPADSLEALAHQWREEAETLRNAHAERQAAVLERCAGELEAAHAARPYDLVTLEEASEIGGYSYSQLQHLVSSGEIPNAGRKGAPRLYRKDVPVKPGHGASTPSDSPSRPRLELIEDAIQEDRGAASG